MFEHHKVVRHALCQGRSNCSIHVKLPLQQEEVRIRGGLTPFNRISLKPKTNKDACFASSNQRICVIRYYCVTMNPIALSLALVHRFQQCWLKAILLDFAWAKSSAWWGHCALHVGGQQSHISEQEVLWHCWCGTETETRSFNQNASAVHRDHDGIKPC